MVLLNPFTTHMHTRSSLISSLSSGSTHAGFPLAEPSELSILGRARISNHQVWNCGFVFVCAYIFHQFISFFPPKNFLMSDIFRVHFPPHFFACPHVCVCGCTCLCWCMCLCLCCVYVQAEQMAPGWETQCEVRRLPPNSYARAHTHICKDQSLISLS